MPRITHFEMRVGLRAAMAIGMFVLAATHGTQACTILSKEGAEAAARKDHERQRALTRELSARADLIFLGSVAEVSADGSLVTFAVHEVIKGAPAIANSLVLRFSDPGMADVTIACTRSSYFQDLDARPGEHIVYVLNGTPLRSARTERESGDISLKEELKPVRR